jgi:hypothetical protein
MESGSLEARTTIRIYNDDSSVEIDGARPAFQAATDEWVLRTARHRAAAGGGFKPQIDVSGPSVHVGDCILIDGWQLLSLPDEQ